MARTRNWPALTVAEVMVRLGLGQSIYRVAKATGLTYMQVKHFASQERPTNLRLPTDEQMVQVRTAVAAADEADEAADTAALAAKKNNGLTPEQQAAYEEEIGGCIDLVRQAASLFGVTPRQFLHKAMTDARSAE